jgi:hypothetical protein
LGKLQEASETWRQTIEINPSTDIARKTGILVKKLTQKKSEKPWSVSLRAGIEYDDNVTVSLQDLASGVDDYSSVFEFSGDYKFLKTKKFELQAGYDFYQSLYHELTEFNLQSHIFSLGGGYKINGVNTDVFTSYNRTTLGGEDFLESYSVAPQIGFFPSEKWYALIGYSYEDFEFFTDRSRDGESHSFGLDNFIFFMGGKSYILIGYRFEDRKTRDDQFTYEGHFATLGIKTPLPIFDRKGSFNLSYRYFYKDYTNVTPSLNQERRDFRHTIHVGLSQPLCEWLALNLSYEFIDSVSNLRAIDFTENVASLSLSITF